LPDSAFPELRPLLDLVVVGHTLTQGDVSEIREALLRRDTWIEHYRQQEVALNERLQARRAHLDEVLQNLYAPILGYGVQEGRLSGLHHDRWVGPRFALTIQPKRAVTRVTVNGWVPDEIPAGGQLVLRIGDRTIAQDLVPRIFWLSIDIPEGTEELILIEVEATRWVTPEGPQGRMLAFVLRDIELGH
jgi:hypothetical protein